MNTPQSRPVLQVGPLKPSLAQTLQDDYAAYVLPDEPADVSRRARRRDQGVVGRRCDDVDGALRMARWSTRRRLEGALWVSNTPDVLTDCVADTAVGLTIDTLRQFSASDRYVRAGRWPVEGNYPLTRQVSNTRVGIIGLGRIGSAIALRLSAFGCQISYHNRRPVEGSPYRYVGSPLELARGVDVLIVAAAGGDGTRRLVSREVIEALGADGYLINIARGSVVDEDALVDALGGGRLAGAGLDVFEDEPNVPGALLTMDNVVVLPHVASGTVETRAAMEELTLRNLDSFLKSGQLVTPVPMPVAASG